ncbi:DUF87 domain-containing protein [Clostridiaceae bacterium DONG20-135]|uniref:DUF87 domain-containing protein n=1 Tax=Copranaerobaculum intestinale TaxID=2692629 RepID=A0A6N8U6R1_9FIRM|nr:DNA translocase FtsK [Copranaerobaculum intestinale]MXQ73876.1 DUF87 domain-containing protein [Copranaerobaculum intestinale]
MAKSKSRKNQKDKQAVENEILMYIYALVLIALSIIGLLKIGPVGQITTNIVQYIFGNMYGIFYACVIIISFMMMLKKSLQELPLKQTIGLAVLLCAWLLLAAIPKDEALKGMDVVNYYLSNSGAIFKGELPAQGGLIGAILYTITSALFDRTGTYIIIFAMVILSIIVLVNKNMIEKLTAMKDKMLSPFQQMREKRREKKKAQEESEEADDKENLESEFKMIDLEEKPKPKHRAALFGRIQADEEPAEDEFDIPLESAPDGTQRFMFLDVDDIMELDKPQEKEPQLMHADESSQTKKQAVIDQTIGQKDTFVSSFQDDYKNYRLPRISLLNDIGKRNKSTANLNAASAQGKRLIEILDQFGVKATLVGTHIGPSVTKFEVKPDLGVRVHKISNLQYDIKMALAAKDIRIEAPIPGKSAVGIEIPNIEKTTVMMKELMRTVPAKYDNKKLMFVLGKDLMGNNIYGELNKMPHLLIAGATGSGKSVCVNSIITSILMRAKPDEVKLLLVDPKKVEFTPYRQIPHLLGPVITDGEEASRALKVVVNMMDNRYELFSQAGVRNISGYNAYIEEHPEEGLSKMPWVVVIIDELADLMLVAAKDVESSIQRITQLARAAGIHLIVATQRPSVDVITGIIKANIPSRIAFAVSSAVDSRTILDQVGAEKLLGNGDMLYIPVGEQNAVRAQGVFVSDDEVNSITDYVSAQGRPKFDDAFVRLEVLDNGSGMHDNFSDPLYDEVKEFVVESRKASTSLIQRKFSIGYSRAARLIDVLEERGIIGPSRGSKPREVYMKNERMDEDDESA